MLKLGLTKPARGGYKILCLGAHSDDIEIGCGGTMLKMAREHPDTQFYWVIFSADKRRATEARASFNQFLKNAPSRKLVVKNFKESYFPYNGAAIKDYFEKLKTSINPDLVLTHRGEDRHQDHRLISELTWNTFRSHLILEYEIPKYDGDLGSPNVFVELDRNTVQRKVSNILSGFPSQKSRQWFDRELLLSVLRLRGMECDARSKYAEAFYCRKVILD